MDNVVHCKGAIMSDALFELLDACTLGVWKTIHPSLRKAFIREGLERLKNV